MIDEDPATTFPVTIGARRLSPGKGCADYIYGLGVDLASTGACLEPFGNWFYYLTWNLTLAALLQTAGDRAVLADDIAWLDKPLTPREQAACDGAHLATQEVNNHKTLTLAERCHEVQLLTATMEDDLVRAVEAACGRRVAGDEDDTRTDHYDNSLEVWGVLEIDLDAAAQNLKESGFDRVWLHQHSERENCKCPCR